jgi:hypothetical protein
MTQDSQRSHQPAPHRSTESGNHSVSTYTKSGETRHHRAMAPGPGRPKGSKNKPKGLIPKELAYEFLDVVKTVLPKEHYEEMKKAVLEGKSISTMTEAKITLKLMGPPIWKRLIEEAQPPKVPTIDPDMEDEIGEAPRDKGFARDLNERLKVYMGLLTFIEGMERRQADAETSRSQPHIEFLEGRGIDTSRLRVLVGVESSSVGRDPDGVGRVAIETGTIPDKLPERQVSVSDSEEGPSVGVLDSDSDRDDPREQHEA